MAEASLENLNKVTTGADSDGASPDANRSANIILQWVDTEGVLDRQQIEEARAKLPALRERYQYGRLRRAKVFIVKMFITI
jgi:hypothetical protein